MLEYPNLYQCENPPRVPTCIELRYLVFVYPYISQFWSAASAGMSPTSSNRGHFS
jgi:hypothetical protein